MRKVQNWLTMWLLSWMLLVGSCAANNDQPSANLKETPKPPVSSPINSDRELVAKELRSELPKIKKLTKIPILLPSELPPEASHETLYSYSEGSASGYDITLGTEPKCGANVCLVGVFKAK